MLLCALGGVLPQRTRYGQGVYAIGGSEDAAAHPVVSGALPAVVVVVTQSYLSRVRRLR